MSLGLNKLHHYFSFLRGLHVKGTRGMLWYLSRTQYHSSKASILWRSAFFTVQLSHPYMTTGKTIALTGQTFVGRVMSLLFNMLSRLVITSLPRSKHFLISWLQSSSAVIRFLQMTSSELVCFWKTCKIVSSLCSSPTLGLLYSSHSIRVMIQESELRTQTQTTK